MKGNQAAGTWSRAGTRTGSQDEAVELKLTAPKARSVSVAGSFNGWDAKSNPLNKESGGVWRTSVSLSPGRYEYRFVVDGQWQEDPTAKESAFNPYGGRNSVLVVRGPSRRAIAEAEDD
ncbi:MAG TPA: glycogen-binding domain-containing protein [Verrucomicrobiae bacterium]|nr:glycogen-binding domain-containing protein [Verrucomicrobiae bacterium]